MTRSFVFVFQLEQSRDMYKWFIFKAWVVTKVYLTIIHQHLCQIRRIITRNEIFTSSFTEFYDEFNVYLFRNFSCFSFEISQFIVKYFNKNFKIFLFKMITTLSDLEIGKTFSDFSWFKLPQLQLFLYLNRVMQVNKSRTFQQQRKVQTLSLIKFGFFFAIFYKPKILLWNKRMN